MADALVRLKIESQEYDAKIKRAQEGLTRYADECRKCGGTLEYVEKETLEYVKSLGQMDMVSRTTKGKIAELRTAYQELGVQYKQLTNAEKNAPYGQALAGSLQQLKGRISELNGQLSSTTKELDGGGGFGKALEAVSHKIGLPVSSLTTLGVGLAAAAGAAKVAKDAFFNNEQQLDEWGRVTESAGSIYTGFLNALNTGDIGGYLSNISDIVTAARGAYNALDELGTFNAFNQINTEKARTGFTEAITNFREGKGDKKDVQAAADLLKNELGTRQQKEQAAYEVAVRKLAAERGANGDDLLKALSGTYGSYEALKATQMPTKQVYNSSIRDFVTVVDREAATLEQKLGDALRHINDTELQEVQALGAQAQRTATEIEQIDRQVVRYTGAAKQKTKTASGKDTFKLGDYRAMPEAGSLADLEAQAAMVRNSMKGATTTEEYKEMQRQLDILTDKMKALRGETEQTFAPGSLNDLNQQLREAQECLNEVVVGSEAWYEELEKVKTVQEAINAAQAQINSKATDKSLENEGRSAQAAWQGATQAVSAVSGALQQVDDPSAKIAGIIGMAIANIAGGLGSMLAQPQSTAQSWGWIALAASGAATMISTIAAVKSATAGYAEGGLVLPNGNPYGGDNIVARLNAGEGVLTARGIANAEAIADNLQHNGMAGGIIVHISGRVSGKDILLAGNNYNRARGGSRGAYTKIK